jgi:hypothetical protein
MSAIFMTSGPLYSPGLVDMLTRILIFIVLLAAFLGIGILNYSQV